MGFDAVYDCVCDSFSNGKNSVIPNWFLFYMVYSETENTKEKYAGEVMYFIKKHKSMVCPWNGFRPCYENRCPFWRSLYRCARASMEMTR